MYPVLYPVGSKPTSRPKNLPTSTTSESRRVVRPHLTPPSRLHIGTSGWAYPTWKPGFYPEKTPTKKFLSHYATRLTSVEVNYTFRTLPTPAQLRDWLAAAPAPFRFTFKAPQRITHFSRLLDCEAHLQQFLASIAPIADAGQLGLLLFQLPPNFKATPATLNRLDTFLQLSALAPYRLAFEFRHDTWFAEAAYAILRRHNAALCIADSDDLITPWVHTASTHTAFRFRRNGGYTPRELRALATRLAPLAQDRDVYAYLKHEDEPTGPLNAVALLKAAAKPTR